MFVLILYHAFRHSTALRAVITDCDEKAARIKSELRRFRRPFGPCFIILLIPFLISLPHYMSAPLLLTPEQFGLYAFAFVLAFTFVYALPALIFYIRAIREKLSSMPRIAGFVVYETIFLFLLYHHHKGLDYYPKTAFLITFLWLYVCNIFLPEKFAERFFGRYDWVRFYDASRVTLLLEKEKKTRFKYERAIYIFIALVFMSLCSLFSFLEDQAGYSYYETLALIAMATAALVFGLLPGSVIITSFRKELEDSKLDYLFLAGFAITQIIRSKWVKRFHPLVVAAFFAGPLIFLGAIVQQEAELFAALFEDMWVLLFVGALSIWAFSGFYFSISMASAVVLLYRSYTAGMLAFYLVTVVFAFSEVFLFFTVAENTGSQGIILVTNMILLINAFCMNYLLPKAIYRRALKRYEKSC